MKQMKVNFNSSSDSAPKIIIPVSLQLRQSPIRKKTSKHQDSLVFSITTQKYPSSKKQTILLQSSKQYPTYQLMGADKDIESLQVKLKKLQQKVQNITTQYCEDMDHDEINIGQNKQNICTNWEFNKENNKALIPPTVRQKDLYKKIVKTVYCQNYQESSKSNIYLQEQEHYQSGIQNEKKTNKVMQNQSKVGKIKRKSSHNKYYSQVQPVIVICTDKEEDNSLNCFKNTRNDNLKNKQIKKIKLQKDSNLDESLKSRVSTKRINLDSRKRNSKSHQSFSTNRKQVEIKQLKQKLMKIRMSQQKISRQKSHSLQKLNHSKNQIKYLRKQNQNQRKNIQLLNKQLKKKQILARHQKQLIKKQKQEIQLLKISNLNLKKIKQ